MDDSRAGSLDPGPQRIRWERIDEYSDAWYFNGNRRYDDRSGSIVVSRRDLEGSKVTDFRRLMLRARRYSLEPDHVYVAGEALEDFDPEFVVVEPVSFEVLEDGEVAVRVRFMPPYGYVLDEVASEVANIASGFLSRSRGYVIEEARQGYYDHDTLLLGMKSRGKTLAHLFALGEGVSLLAQAYLEERPGRITVRDLVLAGHAGLIIGQQENEWFDAKSDHYLHDDRSVGKIMLARAIAQFCNGDDGGTIIVGMKTGKTAAHDAEKVVKLTPVPLGGKILKQYRAAVENHLFPFPVGLQIDSVEDPTRDGHGYIVITIPPQQEEQKPFLVHGALLAGKAEGGFFTIIRRSGEDGLPMHASQVHSMLVTGRALLRHGLVSPDSASSEPHP